MDAHTVEASSTSPRALVAAGAAVWLASAFVAVAWWTSLFHDGSITDPDRMWQPLGLGDGVRAAAGITATVLLIAGAVLGRRPRAQGSLSQTAAVVTLALGAIAASAGLVYGAATAPVVGANIGAGILLLGVAPMLLVVAVVAGLALRRPVTA